MILSEWVAVAVVGLAALGLGNKRLSPAIRTYGTQAFLLGALVAVEGRQRGDAATLALGLALVALKGIATPVYLQTVSRRLKVDREVEPVVNIPLSFLAAGACVLAALRVADEAAVVAGEASVLLVAGLSTLLIGLFTMATRRKAITQALGLLTMENGAFLLSLALTGGLPLAVELAVLLDVLVLVMLVGIVVFRMRETFGHVDAGAMRTLGE